MKMRWANCVFCFLLMVTIVNIQNAAVYFLNKPKLDALQSHANEIPHAAEHPGENIVCSEQSMWHNETNEKTAIGGHLDQKLIKKESGEDENFGPTDKNSELQESNLTTHHTPFIDQEMGYNTTMGNDETSETSNGGSEKEKFRKFLYARAIPVLNVYGINSVLQAERLSVVEGYKQLVRQDSSLMPLESSQFQEDDEIVGMMVNMIQKDMRWHYEHHQQAIRE